MARGDISIRQAGGLSDVPVYRWLVVSGAVGSIEAGVFVKQSGTNTRYAALLVDADLTIGTDQPLIGLTASVSTDTVAAEGTVDVYMPLPGIVYEADAQDGTLINTQALIDAMTGDAMVVNVAAGTNGRVTIDTAAGAGANNAFLIVGGDPIRRKLYFMVRQDATFIGRAQV